MSVRVGVIDSGGPRHEIEWARAFDDDGNTEQAVPDRLGHGTAVADTIRRACPDAEIVHAQVFEARPVSSATRVAAALRWIVSKDGPRVDLCCLSLGLSHDRAILRDACEAAYAAGLLMVAARPVTGAPCYPAAYATVLAATGDARCERFEVSILGPGLFGTFCNSPERVAAGMGGASFAAAHLTGHLADLVSKQGRISLSQADDILSGQARFNGPERRRAAT